MRMVMASAAAVLVSLTAAAEARRGGIAFHYATPLSARELEWYSRFEVLVTHDPLPREQVDALHQRGTKLVLYEWAVAFYASLASPAYRALPVLNRAPLRGHLGASDADAFYFDPATPEHQVGRADAIRRRLQSIGYDGVFLDTTTAASVHPTALAEYRERHPGVDYDQAFAGFLKNLRDLLVVTNQGYRRADQVLPYVDWDVSESLITHPKNGAFVLRPWNDPDDRWNSTAYLFRKLIAPAQRKYPRVRFAHINYVNDAGLVDEIVAIARLYDHDAFIARADLASPIETELYFHDFGRPRRRVETACGAFRHFERGYVAYDAKSTSAVIVRKPR